MILLASAQDSNHYFCGSSWDDASLNCNERQHCLGGTDDECEAEGTICFGGTTCDVRLGHGNKFKYANVPYTDISNTRFCGVNWEEAIGDCSIGTHCPTGFSEECPDGFSCYGGLSCNVQDLLEEAAENEGEDGAQGALSTAPRVGKHSMKRHNFCGSSWGDASERCGDWCPEGENTDCPGGMGCFGSTECYYDEDLVPTSTPIQTPTLGPSTIPPVEYSDPANVRFCGLTWALAVANCSVETHCPGGADDCPKKETCHGGISQCNMVDLLNKVDKPVVPTYIPTMSPITKKDPSNSKFCGEGWTHALDNCSLETHCPNDECPEGLICYGGIGCNASEMTTGPTLKPTTKPTDTPTLKPTAPTLSPSLTPTTRTRAPITVLPTISKKPTEPPTIPLDDPRHSYWCGTSWSDVEKNCHAPCITASDSECPAGMTCFSFTPCRPKPKPTPPPTREPTTQKPSEPPSPPPTNRPATNAPSSNPIESTMTPSDKPTEEYFTMRPITSPPSGSPTHGYSAEAEQTVEFIDTEPKPAPLTLPPSPKPTPSTPQPVFKPAPLTRQPSGKPTRKPTRSPTKLPTSPPLSALPPSSKNVPAPSQELLVEVGSVLVGAEAGISSDVLLHNDMATNKELPTKLYQYSGFLDALGLISKGNMGSNYFYLGPNGSEGGANYGLANVALFLAQAAVETIQFDICDEISWEKDVFGRYPISNSCGQGRFSGLSKVSYEDSNPCADNEAFMACPVDVGMSAVAETHGIFAGAPPPLTCSPSTTAEFTGAWDPTLNCEEDGCSSYNGQTKGKIDPSSVPTKNSFGRNNAEGCCWWGRGSFPRGTAGTCLVGKLNYYLGKRAFEEGRPSARYKEVDFCQDPSAICRGVYEDGQLNAEIRWLMGMLYWTNKVQTYNVDGWSYLGNLHEFVNGGMKDNGFLEDVSRLVTRGCHDQSSCGNAVSGGDRRAKFDKIIHYFSTVGETKIPTYHPTPLSSYEPTVEPTEKPTPKPTNTPTEKPTPPPTNTPSQLSTDLQTTKPKYSPMDPTLPPIPLRTSRPTSQPNLPPTDHPTLRATIAAKTSFPVSLPPVATASSPKEIPSSLTTEGFGQDNDYQLTPEELANRLNFANNYCASSTEEAEAKCAISLRTCNFEDPPCKQGLRCVGNVFCSIVWSDIAFESATESSPEDFESSEKEIPLDEIESSAKGSSSDEVESGMSEIPPESDSFTGALQCNGICIRPLSANECMTGGDTIMLLPECSRVAIGEMCENIGECVGGAAIISNCPGGRGIFMRVQMEKCGASTSYPPSTNGSYSSIPPSSKPPSLAQDIPDGTQLNHENSHPVDDSGGSYEDFFGTARQEDESNPGGWWVWYEANGSIELLTRPMLLLLCCTVTLALAGA